MGKRGRPRKHQPPTKVKSKPRAPQDTPEVIELRKAITDTIREAYTLEAKSGLAYARAVAMVCKGMDAGMTRRDIAVAIRTGIPATTSTQLVEYSDGKLVPVQRVHKGTGARYIMLARWQRAVEGKESWLEDEKPLTGPVTIAGRRFRTPLDALESGTLSFRQVFIAFRDAIRPQVKSFKALPKSPAESARRQVERLTLPVLVQGDEGEKPARVRVTESPEAFAAMLEGLLTSSIGRKLVASKTRTSVLAQVQKFLTSGQSIEDAPGG